MAGEKRVDARKATLAVLDALKRKTDKNHTLSIMRIVEELSKEPYELVLHRDTVKKILSSLQEFKQLDGKVCYSKTERKGANGKEDNDYTYAYYWERKFSDEEIQVLIDDVMFSTIRTEEQVKELTRKLKGLVSEDFAKKLNYLNQIPDKQYTMNELTQKNIAMIHQLIAKNNHASGNEVWLKFTFNGYGTDKKLHPTGRYSVYPIRICEANSNYYLMCAFENSQYPAHYRIDLMTELEEELRNVQKDSSHRKVQERLSTKSMSEYISQHPYMYYESEGDTVKTYILQIEKIKNKKDASMTFLYDMFGRNWDVVAGTETDASVQVRVRAISSGMQLFVRQYQDRVTIISP